MKASRVKDESGGRRFLTEEAAVVAHSGFYFPLELSLFYTHLPLLSQAHLRSKTVSMLWEEDTFQGKMRPKFGALTFCSGIDAVKLI